MNPVNYPVIKNSFYEVEKYCLDSLLDQCKDMVKSGMMKLEQAVMLIGNLVDMDKMEAESDLEIKVFGWLDDMEQFDK